MQIKQRATKYLEAHSVGFSSTSYFYPMVAGIIFKILFSNSLLVHRNKIDFMLILRQAASLNSFMNSNIFLIHLDFYIHNPVSYE